MVLGIVVPRLASRRRRSLIAADAAGLLGALEAPPAPAGGGHSGPAAPGPGPGQGQAALRLVPWDQTIPPGQTVRLAGPPEACAALARTWLAAAWTAAGPPDVSVSLAADLGLDLAEDLEHDLAVWAWTRWLRPGPGALRCEIVGLPAEPSGEAAPAALPVPPATIPLLPAAVPTFPLAAPDAVRLVIGGSGAGDGVPAATRVEARPTGAGLVVARLEGSAPRVIAPPGPAALDAAARGTGRRTATPPPRDLAAALPAACLAERWASPHLAVPIGTDPAGQTVTLDLPRDGPHLLVAGATGSGKSEFLRALMLGAALSAGPDEVTVVGIDHKGGATFADLGDLPHLAAVVTDLDAAATRRALASLTAEMARRERLLESRGLADAAHLAGPDRVPRLLIVIDEFRALVEALPEAQAGLERLAAQGRSLAMHLVLATQRPAGAVSQHLRANLALRLCFRVAQEADSLDVIGSPEACHISPAAPGTAYLASAGRPLRRLRALLACGPTPAAPCRRTWPHAWAPPPPGPLPAPSSLVAGIAAAAHRADLPPAPPPWLPPLPPLLALADLRARFPAPPGASTIAIGLEDRPERLDQGPLLLDPGRGHVLVVGARNSGRTTSAHTVAAACLARGWEIHALTASPDAFADLTGHPRFGSLVPLADARRCARLLALLQRLPPATEPLRRVLVVDDAERLTPAPGQLDHPLEPLAGAADGLWVVATCLARHAGARWTAHFPMRLALPTVDAAEDIAAGVPQALAGMRPTPGRAAVLGAPGVPLAQIAVAVGSDAALTAAATMSLSISTSSWSAPAGSGDARGPGGGADPTPLRLQAVPSEAGPLPPPRPGWAWIGYGGDDAGPVALPLREGGRVGVVGPPGSGRTSVLRVIADQAEATGRSVDRIDAAGERPGGAWQRAWAALAIGAVAVIDDAELAGPVPGDPPSTGTLVLGLTTRAAAGFAGPGTLLRDRPCGLVLQADEPGSAEAFGVRLAEAIEPGRRPGLGVAVLGHSVQPVQCTSPPRAPSQYLHAA
jgi:S-DNA-T family DNA segregation ATPase FtsK/SpoIIIE